jgi:hypothetical protein
MDEIMPLDITLSFVVAYVLMGWVLDKHVTGPFIRPHRKDELLHFYLSVIVWPVYTPLALLCTWFVRL